MQSLVECKRVGITDLELVNVKKENHLKDQVLEIISPYSDWWCQHDDGMQEKAKRALSDLYKQLIKVIPEKEYNTGGIHTYYLFYLLRLRKEFEQKNYVVVCHELYNLVIRTHFFQARVLYNVVELFEKYLEVGEKNVQ